VSRKAFALALESMGKPAFRIGRVAPTPGLVNQYFNDSTGAGDHGEVDTRGPWNERVNCETLVGTRRSIIAKYLFS
jgi:hypothetical protein